MEYVTLGRSNLKVSRLILGAMGFGDPSWRSWVLGAEASRAIMRRALDLGINAVDTCNFYSLGKSEEIVGAALKDFVRREDIVIATKAGNPMWKSPNAGGFSRKHLFEAVDASLKRLDVDYIDLYQTHIWNPTTNLEEMVGAFDALVRSGKILYAGITDIPFWQFATAELLAKHKGRARFASVQNHYNPIWREDERDLMPFCRVQGIALISYSPMGRGFLCGRERRDAKTGSERNRSDDYAQKLFGRASDEAVADAILAIAKARGVQPAQVALAWTLSRPGMTAPVFGATKPDHVDAAVAALDLKLDPAEIKAIEAPYVPRPAAGHG
ncbi:MAG: aldo/keto reductase [Alphaproteobacteria bacterium]